MNSLWPSRGSNEASTSPNKPEEGQADAAAVADTGPGPSEQPNPPQPSRPLLVRNSSAQPPPPAVPPPQSQPPPPPVGNAPPPPSDSLSLAQLRRIVAEFPKNEAVAYDFTYEDMGPVDEEIDEWFVYQFWQWVRLSNAQRAFETQWDEAVGVDISWEEADEEARYKLVADAVAGLSSSDTKERLNRLGILLYVVLGRWKHTAGHAGTAAGRDSKARSASTSTQLQAMKNGAKLVGETASVSVIWDALRKSFEPFW